MAICNGCSFSGNANQFAASLSAYHDLRCPRCGTTDINTKLENENIKGYGYGDNNTLQKKNKGRDKK